MGYNIGPTIAVKGESEYNAAIKKISTNMKLVASEAGRMTAEFGKNNTSTEALKKKGESLNKALGLQEQAVKRTEDALKKMRDNGVDESSEAYVKLETNLNQAKTALANTKTEVKENEEALQKGGKQTKDYSEKWSNFAAGAGKAAVASLKAIAVSMAAIATGAVIAGKKIFELSKTSGEWADELLTTSKQTDISTEDLQGLSYAARFVDTELEDMTKGMGKVVTSMREATSNGASYISITDGMTVSMLDANGQIKTTQQMFYDTVDALKAIEDPTKRDIAAQEVFGKSYQDMKPLIDAGSGALKKYADEAKNAGLILSNDAVNALGNFDDQMQKVGAQTETAGKLIALSFLPAVSVITGGVSEILSTVTTALSDGFQESDITTITNAITTQIQKALEGVQKNAPAFISVVTNVLSSLINTAVTTLPTLLPVLVNAATGLLTSVLSSLQANAVPIANAITQMATMIATFITSNLPMLVETAAQILVAVALGISNQLPTLIPTIIDVVLQIVDTLVKNAPMLTNAAVQLMIGLTKGLINAIPTLVKMLPQIVLSMVNALIGQISVLINAGRQMMQGVANGATEYLGKLADVGANAIKGFWNGITNTTSWLWGKLKGWVNSVLSYIKNLFGIHSPATSTKPFGKFLVYGLGDGVDENADYAKNAWKRLLNGLTGETYNPSIIASVTGKMASGKSSSASSSRPLSITVPVILDGREIARATAPYTGEQLSWMGV